MLLSPASRHLVYLVKLVRTKENVLEESNERINTEMRRRIFTKRQLTRELMSAEVLFRLDCRKQDKVIHERRAKLARNLWMKIDENTLITFALAELIVP